jgi:hypothetical protein
LSQATCFFLGAPTQSRTTLPASGGGTGEVSHLTNNRAARASGFPWSFDEQVPKFERMNKWLRFIIATLAAAAVVLPYYAIEFRRGYVKEGFTHFPLVVGFTDLPHCPSCDHIGLSSRLFEMVVVSVLIFGFLSLSGLLKKK